MKVTMMLADAAQAVGGKLYILGAGWSVAGPHPPSFAIAVKFEVPWDESNVRHPWRLSLLDEDGRPVVVPGPVGEQPLILEGHVETGRPAGLKPGTPLDSSMAVTFQSLPLTPGGRYEWVLTVADARLATCTFTMREASK